jgi:hypothetical protein
MPPRKRPCSTSFRWRLCPRPGHERRLLAADERSVLDGSRYPARAVAPVQCRRFHGEATGRSSQCRASSRGRHPRHRTPEQRADAEAECQSPCPGSATKAVALALTCRAPLTVSPGRTPWRRGRRNPRPSWRGRGWHRAARYAAAPARIAVCTGATTSPCLGASHPEAEDAFAARVDERLHEATRPADGPWAA